MLKSLLSLLLSKFYSKTESELVAHQAFPGQESQTLFYGEEVDSWATVGTGVAPFDGYLQLKAQGKAIDGIVEVSGSTVTTAVQFPWATATVTGWTKVAKGETWIVEGCCAQNISLEIFKTIGGGYKALKRFVLQGDGLCLSLSFNCLQKRFSRVDTKTLPFKSEGRTRAKSQLLLQTFLNGAIRLRHQVMSLFEFRRLRIRGSELIMSLPGCPISQITTGHGRLQRFQSKKETLSFSDYRPRLMFQRLRAGLLLAFVNLKLNKGGATC